MTVALVSSIAIATLIIVHNQIFEIETRNLRVNSESYIIPGGFEVTGTCDLHKLVEEEKIAHLGMFVKHGLHTTNRKFFPEDCPNLMRNSLTSGHVDKEEVTWYPSQNVHAFIRTKRPKLLAVRNRASFYKSAFNHVCNKMTKYKIDWRQNNNIDCSRKGEFDRIMKMDEQELALRFSPFLLKSKIMKSWKVRQIMLVDYTCISQVVSIFCGDDGVNDEIMEKIGTNSAESQHYVDFWSMHNNTLPANRYGQFWDQISDKLSETCCLDLRKPR